MSRTTPQITSNTMTLLAQQAALVAAMPADAPVETRELEITPAKDLFSMAQTPLVLATPPAGSPVPTTEPVVKSDQYFPIYLPGTGGNTAPTTNPNGTPVLTTAEKRQRATLWGLGILMFLVLMTVVLTISNRSRTRGRSSQN